MLAAAWSGWQSADLHGTANLGWLKPVSLRFHSCSAMHCMYSTPLCKAVGGERGSMRFSAAVLLACLL